MPEIAEQTTLPEAPLSLREELAANLADISPPEIPSDTGQPAAQEEAAKPGRTAGRARDEQGKLLPGKAQREVQAQEPEQPAAPAAPAVQAPPRPSSWKKDFWADYDKIATENPALAKYLNDREHQFASGVSTYKQEWEQAKPLLDAIAPFQPILQQNGINPAQWVSNLGNAHQRLAMGTPQDKVAMFQQLARDYQVPVALAVQGPDGNYQLLGQQQMPQQPQQPQQPAFDPRMVSQLVQQELTKTQTQQQLDAFTKDVPTKYPHFEAVKATMAGLLQAELAQDLPSAYEAALRHPRHADLFDAMQQQQREQQEAEAKAAQQQTVRRARSNVVSIPSATPGGQAKGGGEKGLREELAENLRSVTQGRI